MKDTKFYKQKIEEILKKDYNHELPDKPRSAEFNRAIKSMLKAMFPDCSILPTNGAWCQASGFIKSERTGKCVYYCFNDYRYSQWDGHFYIRSCRDEKDYVGYTNYAVLNLADLRFKACDLLGIA